MLDNLNRNTGSTAPERWKAKVTQRETITVTVQRGSAATGQQAQEFQVPAYESQTVLDVVSWIQQHTDPTLTYRFACRVGMCGSCAMMVNGVPRWTCRTHVKKVLKDQRIDIAPLRNLPVIKDLAADMDPFFDKWVAAEGRHHPTDAAKNPLPPSTPKRKTARLPARGLNASTARSAMRPAILSRAIPIILAPPRCNGPGRCINDAKDADRGAILDAVSGKGGCHSCHSMGSCTAYCPNGLDPLSAIAGLKRATTRRFFGGGA
jgi:fumarate reductase iron-sulfur subunit